VAAKNSKNTKRMKPESRGSKRIKVNQSNPSDFVWRFRSSVDKGSRWEGFGCGRFRRLGGGARGHAWGGADGGAWDDRDAVEGIWRDVRAPELSFGAGVEAGGTRTVFGGAMFCGIGGPSGGAGGTAFGDDSGVAGLPCRWESPSAEEWRSSLIPPSRERHSFWGVRLLPGPPPFPGPPPAPIPAPTPAPLPIASALSVPPPAPLPIASELSAAV
jgi:hypothetical protein